MTLESFGLLKVATTVPTILNASMVEAGATHWSNSGPINQLAVRYIDWFSHS